MIAALLLGIVLGFIAGGVTIIGAAYWAMRKGVGL